MQKTLTIVIIALLAVLTAVLCALSVVLFLNNKELKKEVANLKASENQDNGDTGSEGNTDTDTAEDTEEDAELDCDNESSNGEITVTSPCAGETLGSTIAVEGTARAFENTILVSVLDENDDELYQQVITFDAPDAGEFGDFSAVLDWTPSGSLQEGTIKVYEISAADGSDRSVVLVPVKF